MAIDRQGIAAAILRHPASAAAQLLPAAIPAWHDAALPPHLFLTGAAVLPAFMHHRLSALAQNRHLRVIFPFEFRTLTPSETGHHFARVGVSEMLVMSEPDGSISPGVAESWHVAADGLSWHFRMRPARFHDGTPVTAERVKASLEKLVPKSLYLQTAGITGDEAAGQDLVVRLAKPFGPFLACAVDNSAPILAPDSFDAAGSVVSVIGTGPYRVARTEFPRVLELGAFPDYWGRKASITSVIYEGITSNETGTNIALAGDADVVQNVSLPSVQRIAASA
jgi:peptide/nickel transport system substrate-binding protein